MTAEETTTPRPTFQRARRAAVGYPASVSSFSALGRAIAVLLFRFPRLAIAALPAYTAAVALPVFVSRTVPSTPGALGTAFACLVFGLVAFHLLVGFYAGPVSDFIAGERTGVVSFVASGSRSLLVTVALAAGLGVAIAVSSLLAVIPGVLVGLAGYVAIPVAAREGLRPWAALKRSAQFAARSTDLIRCLVLLGILGPVAQAIAFGEPWPPGTGDPSTVTGLLREACYFLPFVLAAILPTVIHDALTRR